MNFQQRNGQTSTAYLLCRICISFSLNRIRSTQMSFEEKNIPPQLQVIWIFCESYTNHHGLYAKEHSYVIVSLEGVPNVERRVLLYPVSWFKTFDSFYEAIWTQLCLKRDAKVAHPQGVEWHQKIDNLYESRAPNVLRVVFTTNINYSTCNVLN